MKKARLFETATAGLVAGAALAAPAAAHHDDPDCENWRGAPVVETGGARLEVRSVRWFDGCGTTVGAALELADGSRYHAVVRPSGADAGRGSTARPATPESGTSTADGTSTKSEKARPRCKKKQQKKSRSKRSARSCRR